MLYLVVDVDTL